jgi:RNA polymerase sigma-19 factor, ECF subfamily
METNEKLLLQQISEGNQKAFESLFNNYYPPLVVFAKKYLNDLDLSRETVQGVFVKLYENKEAIQISSSVKSYLYQSVRNACLNYVEQQKIHSKHHENIFEEHKDANDFTDEMEQSELEFKIYKAIEKLPDQCKLVFKLSRFEGKKNQEIADNLYLSKRTIETQISKALKILRTELIDVFIVLIIMLLQIV